jgi:hypothetical protein
MRPNLGRAILGDAPGVEVSDYVARHGHTGLLEWVSFFAVNTACYFLPFWVAFMAISRNRRNL